MAKLKILTRDAILQAEDLPRELVEVPEWGGCVYVRALTGAERDAFEASVVEQRGKSTKMNLRNIRAKLVALTAVDEEGKRLFTDDDAALLGKKSAAALDRVFDVAQRLSGLKDEDVEELAKNSEDDLSEDSIFG
ncbi:hypothetical protein [Candidatus Darwinibacter acetoxidans]